MAGPPSTQKVENLKKITLSMAAGTSPDDMNLTPAPFSFEFIFGVGQQGLTPFEYALADKTEGDEIVLDINPNEIEQVFEHLALPIRCRLKETQRFFLKACIENISPADSRAIVKAMAGTAECGEGCDCGCGSHGDFPIVK
jgi:hypothetical protein